METNKSHKKKLSAKIARAKTISSSDEDWLDGEASTIDEQCIIDTLESASLYDRGLECLDKNGKAIMRQLRELAGDLVKVAGNKRKCTPFLMPIENKSLTMLAKFPHTRKSLKHPRRNLISQPLLLPLQRRKCYIGSAH